MPDLRQNIVVVDDDNDMNHAIQRLLSAAGFRAIAFRSAESLIEDPAAAADADCLLLDIHLPGLSGFDLRRRLEQDGTQAPVIFITAYDDAASRSEAEAIGAAGYFTKPFPGQALLSAIR